MASRKSKTASVRRSGDRGYVLYLPKWIVKKFFLQPGDSFRVEGENKSEIKLVFEEGTEDEHNK